MTGPPASPWKFWRCGLAVAVRPWLWRAAWAFKPNKGFLPPPEYVALRMETMYADPAHVPGPLEMVVYLEWCRRMRRFAGDPEFALAPLKKLS